MNKELDTFDYTLEIDGKKMRMRHFVMGLINVDGIESSALNSSAHGPMFTLKADHSEWCHCDSPELW